MAPFASMLLWMSGIEKAPFFWPRTNRVLNKGAFSSLKTRIYKLKRGFLECFPSRYGLWVLKIIIHTFCFLLLVFCLLVQFCAIQKLEQNQMFCIWYPITENIANPSKSKVFYCIHPHRDVENLRSKNSLWKQSEPCYCEGGGQ